MIDLERAWSDHVAVVLAERDAPEEIHASDIHSCDFALWQRVNGVEQLPHDSGSFANFERGHAYETRLHDAILAYALPLGYTVTHGETVSYREITGNLDWVLYRDDAAVATIDLSTTAASAPQWRYGHALKSAFYALAKGCDVFCEWVFCIGFGGKIVAQQAHWFSLDDNFRGKTWRQLVLGAIADTKFVAEMSEAPDPQPPADPLEGRLETWRCGKVGKNGVGTSYCRAQCPRNAAYDAEMIPA